MVTISRHCTIQDYNFVCSKIFAVVELMSLDKILWLFKGQWPWLFWVCSIRRITNVIQHLRKGGGEGEVLVSKNLNLIINCCKFPTPIFSSLQVSSTPDCCLFCVLSGNMLNVSKEHFLRR